MAVPADALRSLAVRLRDKRWLPPQGCHVISLGRSYGASWDERREIADHLERIADLIEQAEALAAAWKALRPMTTDFTLSDKGLLHASGRTPSPEVNTEDSSG
jgi:hypothetical protein